MHVSSLSFVKKSQKNVLCPIVALRPSDAELFKCVISYSQKSHTHLARDRGDIRFYSQP